MQLTTAQLQTLKASILANTNVIASGPFAGTQVKDVPNNADGRIAVATWYNLDASPTYKVWQTDVPKATIRSVTVVANYTPTDAVQGYVIKDASDVLWNIKGVVTKGVGGTDWRVVCGKAMNQNRL